MKQIRVLVGVVMTLGLLAACGTSKEAEKPKETAKSQSVINVTSGGELATLDSALYSDVYSSDTIGQIIEGLYRVDSDNEAELAMAAKEPQISEDQRVYTFEIREAKWSNGDSVTAADFVYAFQNVVDPDYGSPSANQMDVIKNAKSIREDKGELAELGVKALDDTHLEITLENPTPYLAKLLTGTPFLPKNQAFAEKLGTDYGTDAEKVLSNGPFTISGWDGTNNEWVFTKNDRYWDADNVQLAEINVSVIKEIGTGVSLFEAGDVDFTVIGDEYATQKKNEPEFQAVPKALIGYIGFNTQREITGNRQARLAIAQAYDKEKFADNILADGSIALNGLVPNNYAKNPETDQEFREENGDLLTYDVKKAQAAWETAKKELGKETIELELLSADSPTAKKTVEFLQAELQSNLPGLKVTIKHVPVAQRLDLNRAGDFDFFFGTWTPDYADPINFLEVYESTGGLNFGKFSNAEYDQGIAAAKADLATKPEERWQQLLATEKLGIGQEAAIAPVYQGSIAFLTKEGLTGVQVFPFGRSVSYRLAKMTD
ncbi:peptide ABC transporter substrate-binding protein [Vagococcus sp. BWB3-3]|uniref:Peptide ABC transporter substrate-binding protein n=1 Tax=Vagococcus allomyrinae TaxID=2794353 RepID=A0A940STZ5_9ENTE|nr:peptide ABC transporter substrate-binding protein [Vagococcus allomyrinae]MBP1043707.1 peptide ABC transporter substrate-binding protein [Vagococcus allomyrinae]